ncbi:MAG: hypothetical protein N4A72_05850 [Bacteroidales bacterium]|jgi:formate C-acetyltransferase|nr:hypothetical protein [Bacteroidales bacterium]
MIEVIKSKTKNLYEQLKTVAYKIKINEDIKNRLKGTDGYINAVIRFRSDDFKVGINVIINNGEIDVEEDTKLDFILTDGSNVFFESKEELDLLLLKENNPDAVVKSILSTKVRIEGNPAHFAYLSYLLSLINTDAQIATIEEGIERDNEKKYKLSLKAGKPSRDMFEERLKNRLSGQNEPRDPGVKHLEDPYLKNYSINNFDRLMTFRTDLHDNLPEITSEQGELITEYYKSIKKRAGDKQSTLDKANAYQYMMANKRPLVRDNDLLAGTMTTNTICGSVTQPYTIGWSIWGELNTIKYRELDRFKISEQTIDSLHNTVFPFWMNNHIQQEWKKESGYPLAAKVFDRMFFYVPWGLNSLNPGSPGFETVVNRGLNSLLKDINKQKAAQNITKDTLNNLNAMETAINGVISYTQNLKEYTKAIAKDTLEQDRKDELNRLADILDRVPMEPATTLHEAIQMIWILFIGIGLESMDDDISVGRLDHILQPFFLSDIEKLKTKQEKEAYIKDAIELVGCFFYRLASHRIAGPTLASWQNSGAPSVSSITVGGISADGKDVVNDMTYIILKVTEMLSLDDPDMDARYHADVNSTTYLKRVCEVNYITSGTPSIYNDKTVIESLNRHLTQDKYDTEPWCEKDIRNWVPCGCVEPVISGKHFAATGDIDTNLMVPVYMAMHNGNHYKWNLNASEHQPFGPMTGNAENFKSFDEFFDAFEQQFTFIYTQMITGGSHQILKAQQALMPCALYSATLDGCITKGKLMTEGGSKYNTAGTSFVGLSDVIDSLMAIKQYVYDKNKESQFDISAAFKELKEAIKDDYNGYRKVYAFVRYKTIKFGSGHKDVKAMTERVTNMIAKFFHNQNNNRGGSYSTGFRSNNNHTVFGNYSKASPSGRLSGVPYTSGLTPSPWASNNILDNLNDVGHIRPVDADNCYTFNVRLSFSKNHSHKENIDIITQKVITYFKKGGMQVQFNMVDTDTLKDAMANPEYYPDLIARVSGYTGYYTKMHKNLQLEIIGRTQFDL